MKLWDRLSKWQSRGLIVLGLIGVGSGLTPLVWKISETVRDVIDVVITHEDIHMEVEYMGQYIQVLSGLIQAELEPVDNLQYETNIAIRDEDGNITDMETVSVRLRRTYSGDTYVFVPLGTDWQTNEGVFFASWYANEQAYSYIDNWGDFHLCYPVGEARTYRPKQRLSMPYEQKIIKK